MTRVPFRFVVLAAVLATPVAAAPPTDNVYALCTVRDVTVANDRMVGKVYRSAIFAAAANYDNDISMTPERGGKVSADFERFVAASRGFRADRQSLSAGEEHYCIEAPLTLAGKTQLEKLRGDWDKGKFPAVDLAVTDWTPPRTAADKRFEARVADYERQQKAGADKYQAELAAVEDVKARNASAAKARLDQFAGEQAAHAVVVAEAERKRQAYREEYQRVTGRYPDN